MDVRWPLRMALSATSAAARRFGIVVERDWHVEEYLHARHLRELLLSRRVDCAVEVGANHGQFHDFLRQEVGWTGPVVSVEPIPEIAAELRRRAETEPGWVVQEVAVGSEDRLMTLNVAVSDGFSSLREASGEAASLFREKNRVARRIDVRVRRLEGLLADTVPTARRIFLKSDTQGWDLEVLRGLGAATAHVVAVQIELPLMRIYAGMPDLGEGIDRLRELGFEVTGLFPVADSRMPDGRIVEIDCVAARTITDAGAK